MEQLKEMLYNLLKEEFANLNLGHPYNLDRLAYMKSICHLLTYYKYVDMTDDDIVKLIQFYEY